MIKYSKKYLLFKFNMIILFYNIVDENTKFTWEQILMNIKEFNETKNLSDTIREYIREKIFLGEYKNKERIVEQELADELNTSRAPVREAIKDLINQGLLYSESNRGTYVLEFTKDDVNEIFKIRTYLESTIFEFLINENILTDKDFRKLQEIVEEMKLIANRKAPYREKVVDFSKKDIKFHKYLWIKSGQKWTIKILFDLYYQLRKAMIIDSESQEDLSVDTKMHQEILIQLKNKEKHKAIKALKEHMSLIKDES